MVGAILSPAKETPKAEQGAGDPNSVPHSTPRRRASDQLPAGRSFPHRRVVPQLKYDRAAGDQTPGPVPRARPPTKR